MADADVEVETFRLPDRVMKPLGVEAYHATSDIFTKLIGEQVIDYDLDAGVQRSDGTVLMPPGLLDEFLTTHKPEPGATGWRHRPGWLPDIAYGDLPLADVTVLLGSDGESGLQPPETAVEQTEAMIKFARSLDPDAWLLYVPEPSESEEERTRLEALVEVERRALPAELLPFEWGYRPRRVVTVRSSCFGALVAAGAEGWVLRPDPTGYDVEETAILDAHRHYRALVDGDVCWARLPEARPTRPKRWSPRSGGTQPTSWPFACESPIWRATWNDPGSSVAAGTTASATSGAGWTSARGGSPSSRTSFIRSVSATAS